MKSLLAFSFMFFSFVSCYGQSGPSYYINGFQLDSISAQYLEAETRNVTLSTRVFLDIDYGQESKIIYNRYNRVADEKGNYIEFKSNMDALNYLINLGYELVETNYLNRSDDIIRVKYLLKKKVR